MLAALQSAEAEESKAPYKEWGSGSEIPLCLPATSGGEGPASWAAPRQVGLGPRPSDVPCAQVTRTLPTARGPQAQAVPVKSPEPCCRFCPLCHTHTLHTHPPVIPPHTSPHMHTHPLQPAPTHTDSRALSRLHTQVPAAPTGVPTPTAPPPHPEPICLLLSFLGFRPCGRGKVFLAKTPPNGSPGISNSGRVGGQRWAARGGTEQGGGGGRRGHKSRDPGAQPGVPSGSQRRRPPARETAEARPGRPVARAQTRGCVRVGGELGPVSGKAPAEQAGQGPHSGTCVPELTLVQRRCQSQQQNDQGQDPLTSQEPRPGQASMGLGPTVASSPHPPHPRQQRSGRASWRTGSPARA